MTPKELKRLSRGELLEILVSLSEENDRLTEENRKLRAELEQQRIEIENCGSIAEAAVQITQILQVAQKTADIYLENVRRRTYQNILRGEDRSR